jgi:hypothetical protein
MHYRIKSIRTALCSSKLKPRCYYDHNYKYKRRQKAVCCLHKPTQLMLRRHHGLHTCISGLEGKLLTNDNLEMVWKKRSRNISRHHPVIRLETLSKIADNVSRPRSQLKSIRGDETVSVNKASPASPQLTARSGQSAQFSVLTAFGCTLTCI